MGTPRDSEKTRARIIDAAGHLFAEKGFKGVTVRDIARSAETPLGALNYHFRSKEALYREVVLSACREGALRPEERERFLELPPREALFLLIREWIEEYRKEDARNWKAALIARECSDPSPVFEEMVQVYFDPLAELVSDLISRVVSRPAEDLQVCFSMVSLIGLLDSFCEYGHFVEALSPGLTERLEREDLLARQFFQMVVQTASTSVAENPGEAVCDGSRQEKGRSE